MGLGIVDLRVRGGVDDDVDTLDGGANRLNIGDIKLGAATRDHIVTGQRGTKIGTEHAGCSRDQVAGHEAA